MQEYRNAQSEGGVVTINIPPALSIDASYATTFFDHASGSGPCQLEVFEHYDPRAEYSYPRKKQKRFRVDCFGLPNEPASCRSNIVDVGQLPSVPDVTLNRLDLTPFKADIDAAWAYNQHPSEMKEGPKPVLAILTETSSPTPSCDVSDRSPCSFSTEVCHSTPTSTITSIDVPQAGSLSSQRCFEEFPQTENDVIFGLEDVKDNSFPVITPREIGRVKRERTCSDADLTLTGEFGSYSADEFGTMFSESQPFKTRVLGDRNHVPLLPVYKSDISDTSRRCFFTVLYTDHHQFVEQLPHVQYVYSYLLPNGDYVPPDDIDEHTLVLDGPTQPFTKPVVLPRMLRR
mmetsp:Transcript_12990/g.22459  ORF Transcript_12990/g.22459 Transcript_12990/m.22459 type:complete len:345 (-) Transcript_12990:1313-2347(-)